MITDPYGVDFITWFDQLYADVPELIIKPKVWNEEDWRSVVELLLADPFCGKIGCPSTIGFSDWRSWALEFIKCAGGSV